MDFTARHFLILSTLALFSNMALAAEETWRIETLQKGEDLSLFSQRIYGTTKRWREILEWNKDRITNPDLIYVGAELRVREDKVEAAALPAGSMIDQIKRKLFKPAESVAPPQAAPAVATKFNSEHPPVRKSSKKLERFNDMEVSDP